MHLNDYLGYCPKKKFIQTIQLNYLSSHENCNFMSYEQIPCFEQVFGGTETVKQFLYCEDHPSMRNLGTNISYTGSLSVNTWGHKCLIGTHLELFPFAWMQSNIQKLLNIFWASCLNSLRN